MEKQNEISNNSDVSELNFTNETPETTAARNEQNFVYSKNKAINRMQRYFKFDKLGTTFKKEIIGGVTTLLAMIYILSVNPGILSRSESIDGLSTMDYKGIFLATALCSFLCTFAMGMFANLPAGLAPSMGMNAMFTFTIANNGATHIGYEGALLAVIISSILFLICSVTPIRDLIIKAIPSSLIKVFGISIALFIAYVGLNEMGWFKESGGLPVADLALLKSSYPYILIGIFTLAIMLVLHIKKVPGAIIIAIIIGFAVSLVVANVLQATESSSEFIAPVTGKLNSAVFKNFDWSYDFSGFASNLKHTFQQINNEKIWTNVGFYLSIFVFIFINFFDTTGTLSAFTVQLNEKTNQHHEISRAALIVDSSSALVGGFLGTSPMTIYIESTTGVNQGARSGFSSIVTSIGFLIAIPLAPIFAAIPQFVTAAACIFVGIMMIGEISSIEWKKIQYDIAAFFSMLFMLTTYSIANGVAMGIIAYSFMMVVLGKGKQVNWSLYVLSVLFIGYFVAFAFIQ